MKGCRYLCLLFLAFFNFHVRGQQHTDTVFYQPLDIPVLLSGTFAELRPNHLHSGIDFRTQGVAGHKIYAADRGYVSRISVAPVGYGKALYITHPNGYTTVYGHLEDFNSSIAAYVKQQQYQQERFEVNLYPDSSRFPVRRGEEVAFSGNSGGSGGPHLHFEVRETRTQSALNPLLFGFGVKDKTAPVIRRLAVYPVGNGSTVNGSTDKLILDLEKSEKGYHIAGNKKLKIVGKVAFGIDTYDQTDGSANRCGPYSIRLWVDSALMFSQTMDRFSFDESRYVNSLIDYAYYVKHHVRFNRLYIEPNNQLRVYDWHTDQGIVSFADSAVHKALVVVRDLNGNSARLNFTIAYTPGTTLSAPVPSNVPEIIAIPGLSGNALKKEFVYQQQGIRIVIPADALYDRIDFECHVSTQLKGLYSKVYGIYRDDTPLHKAMTVEIAADSFPVRLRNKACMVQIEPNGRRSYVGGAYREGKVSGVSRLFGEFAIAVDTVPPRITPINIKNGANMSGVKNIRFKIGDDFSGIKSFVGRIDGQWALFEYDAKYDLISYDFDAERIAKSKPHTLDLQVTDNKDNITTYKVKFTW